MPRILVVSYSRTGHTSLVASHIARALGADFEEIFDPTKRSGIFGYLRSGRQAFFERLAPIGPPKYDPADYNLVIVGTPIWNTSLSAPTRTYLRRHRAGIQHVAFFLTCGGLAIDRVFRQMEDESHQAPLAKLAVRERELNTPAMTAAIDRFRIEIRARLRLLAPAPIAQSA